MTPTCGRLAALASGLAILLAGHALSCASPASELPPVVTISPSCLSFSVVEGETGAPSRTLRLWNSGGAELVWTAKADAEWLALDPRSGVCRGEIDEISVEAVPSDMAPGSYHALITVAAGGAVNTPQTAVVTLAIEGGAAQEQGEHDEVEREQDAGQVPGEDALDALDTAALLDIGYNHPERTVVVEGTVVRSYHAAASRGKPTFLDFHDPYEGYLKCIIWETDGETGQPVRAGFVQAFPPDPETYFLGKRVRVRGRIEIYRGDPEIVLRDPSQIWIVG